MPRTVLQFGGTIPTSKLHFHKLYIYLYICTRSVVKYSNGLTLYALVGLCKMDLVLHITIRTPD